MTYALTQRLHVPHHQTLLPVHAVASNPALTETYYGFVTCERDGVQAVAYYAESVLAKLNPPAFTVYPKAVFVAAVDNWKHEIKQRVHARMRLAWVNSEIVVRGAA